MAAVCAAMQIEVPGKTPYLPCQLMPRPKHADDATPVRLGFAMPAEWERHEATWLGWPHHATDWPYKLDTIRWVYAEMVRRIAPGALRRPSDALAYRGQSLAQSAHCRLHASVYRESGAAELETICR